LQGIPFAPGVSEGAAAALLLSTDHSPEVLQASRNALADMDWTVRAAVVHSIAVRNDPALEADLRLEAIGRLPETTPPVVPAGTN
jgi:HEAT repeat protein